MAFEFGIIFALAALVTWGCGDFLIQRSAKKMGDWETLLVISIMGVIILMPFVYQDFGMIMSAGDEGFYLLLGFSIALFVGALIHFESLKRGKISAVEPFEALEIPVTLILATAILAEYVTLYQVLLILVLMSGLFMLSVKSHHFTRRAWIERGVIMAASAAFLYGVANFLVGFAARQTNPLLAVWFMSAFTLLISLFYLQSNNRLSGFFADVRENKGISIITGIVDNVAWVFIAIAAVFVPISIAFAVSESYVALAALLGIIINKEKLMHHQKIGIAIALSSTVMLAFLA